MHDFAGVRELFSLVDQAYHAIQEWSAPRVLVDGSEAYAAALASTYGEANRLFLRADFVHLLRNPRGCLAEWQRARATKDTSSVEQWWTTSTREMEALREMDARWL